MKRAIKGGLSFAGRKQRPLFLSQTADGQREHDIQASFFLWLRLNEARNPTLALFYAVPNGGKRDVRVAVKLKKEGVRAGVPDTHLPVARGGFAGLWIEFKAGRNKLTELQAQWKAALETEMHKVVVCRSWQEAARETIEYLNLINYTPVSAFGVER